MFLESRLRDEGYPSFGIPGNLTPLMSAMMTASVEIVSMLLECGANAECVDAIGNDAFMFASLFGRPKNMQYWLDRFENYDLERGNTVSMTSLILAAYIGSNKLETVKTLCNNGARVDAISHMGLSVRSVRARGSSS